MKELSVGAQCAWAIAMEEAKARGHQYVEKEHIFIGICSLEKIVESAGKLKPEYHALECLLYKYFGSGSTPLRRLVRERLGIGNYVHNENDPIHRSDECRKVFERAEGLVTPGGEVSCLHLLAAILDEPGNIIEEILIGANVSPKALQEHVLTCATRKYGRNPFYHTVFKVVQIGTSYFGKYGKELTQTKVGKSEIILGVIYLVLFISTFILRLWLPDTYIEYLHRFHEAAIFSFIPILVGAEAYYVIRGLARGEEFFKLLKHVGVSLLLFSILIVGNLLAYKWFLLFSKG